jgi:hypothetical protein
MGTINDACNLLNVSQFPSFNDGSQVLSYKWVNKNHVKAYAYLPKCHAHQMVKTLTLKEFNNQFKLDFMK